uniref:Uncharacterized protein n=1 Tax=mine drainage metagenome TaxID=410659 RepID=E6QE08_9ZZZZ
MARGVPTDYSQLRLGPSDLPHLPDVCYWQILPVPNLDVNGCSRCLCVCTHKQRYVYYVIMYSAHVELAVSPVNAGHLVGAVSRCYT